MPLSCHCDDSQASLDACKGRSITPRILKAITLSEMSLYMLITCSQLAETEHLKASTTNNKIEPFPAPSRSILLGMDYSPFSVRSISTDIAK